MFGVRCIHLNTRSVLAILMSLVLNGIKHTDTAINHMEITGKPGIQKNTTNLDWLNAPPVVYKFASPLLSCPTDLECTKLPLSCVKCDTSNNSCQYGKEVNITCEAQPGVQCRGEREFNRPMICRYCWQTEIWEHSCVLKDNCNSAHQTYFANCSVNPDLLCLGTKTFSKKLRCNWTIGYKWSTTLIISITLGGFGADRFYLGHWQEGIGKLFSFGGLGVWTLIDVILISLHYLGPADGSLYI